MIITLQYPDGTIEHTPLTDVIAQLTDQNDVTAKMLGRLIGHLINMNLISADDLQTIVYGES